MGRAFLLFTFLLLVNNIQVEMSHTCLEFFLSLNRWVSRWRLWGALEACWMNLILRYSAVHQRNHLKLRKP